VFQPIADWVSGAWTRVTTWLGGIELDSLAQPITDAWTRVTDWLGGISFAGFDLPGLLDGVRGRIRDLLNGIQFAGAGNVPGAGSGGGGTTFADSSPYLPMLTQGARGAPYLPMVTQSAGVGAASSWLPMLSQGVGSPDWLPMLTSGGGAVLSKEDSAAVARAFKTGMVEQMGLVGAEQPSVMTALVTAGGGKVDVSAWLPMFLSSVDSGMQGENAKAIEEKGGSAWGIFEKGFVAKARNSAALNSAVEAMVEGAINKILGD
jgi:hypothetical protein